MNFSPFGGHFTATIPTIHQFAAKFTHDNTVCPPDPQESNSNRYTANGVPSFTHHHPPQQPMINPPTKFQPTNYINQSHVYQTGAVRHEKRYDQQELAQELCAAMLHQGKNDKKQESQEDRRQQETQQQQVQSSQHQQSHNNQLINTSASMSSTWQSLATPGSTVADYLSHLPASTLPLSLHHFLKYSAENIKKETVQQQLGMQNNDSGILHGNLNNTLNTNSISMNANVLNSNASLASNTINSLSNLSTINTAQLQTGVTPPKKKKKKKAEKEKKPRPKPGIYLFDIYTDYCPINRN